SSVHGVGEACRIARQWREFRDGPASGRSECAQCGSGVRAPYGVSNIADAEDGRVVTPAEAAQLLYAASFEQQSLAATGPPAGAHGVTGGVGPSDDRARFLSERGEVNDEIRGGRW